MCLSVRYTLIFNVKKMVARGWRHIELQTVFGSSVRRWLDRSRTRAHVPATHPHWKDQLALRL
jgi:hypothetical protein